jgi:hypothetical protein
MIQQAHRQAGKQQTDRNTHQQTNKSIENIQTIQPPT